MQTSVQLLTKNQKGLAEDLPDRETLSAQHIAENLQVCNRPNTVMILQISTCIMSDSGPSRSQLQSRTQHPLTGTSRGGPATAPSSPSDTSLWTYAQRRTPTSTSQTTGLSGSPGCTSHGPSSATASAGRRCVSPSTSPHRSPWAQSGSSWTPCPGTSR